MNIISRCWHPFSHRKDVVVRLLQFVHSLVDKSDPETMTALQSAYQTSSPAQAEFHRSRLLSDLEASISFVPQENHGRDDHFESHDQIASLAQTSINEHLTHLANEADHPVMDNADALFQRYGDFDLIGWTSTFLHMVAKWVHLQTNWPFKGVDVTDDNAYVTLIEEQCRIILVSDWGADNESADRIAAQIKHQIDTSTTPAYLIHLGDIYYSGTERECLSFLKKWPLRDDNGLPQKKRSFALNGNHEMYSGGRGYFSLVLPGFGQEASFFLLRHRYWNFFGLDTAYAGGTLRKQTVAHLEEQFGWLARQMDSSSHRKHVFLTHNQPISADKKEYLDGAPLRADVAALQEGQLRPIYGWFFGHQHKCYIYENTPEMKVSYKARLIGNGAFPHDVQRESAPETLDGKPLMGFATLDYKSYEGGLAYSGFVVLDVNSDFIDVHYINEDRSSFHDEGWSANSPVPE